MIKLFSRPGASRNSLFTHLAIGGLLVFSACEAPPKTGSKPSSATARVVSTSFELRNGDRVVFLGDTLMEREQYYGWIEVMLTTRFPNRNVTFRNLGWSADLPDGTSRMGLSL